MLTELPATSYGNQDNDQISIPKGLTSSTAMCCSVILRLQRMPVVQTCDLILFIILCLSVQITKNGALHVYIGVTIHICAIFT